MTTYTGNTPQTGDVYAQVGSHGANLTNIGDSRLAHLNMDLSLIGSFVGINVGVRDMSYTGNLCTSATIYAYDTPTNAANNDGVTGVVGKVLVTSQYTGTNLTSQSSAKTG